MVRRWPACGNGVEAAGQLGRAHLAGDIVTLHVQVVSAFVQVDGRYRGHPMVNVVSSDGNFTE